MNRLKAEEARKSQTTTLFVIQKKLDDIFRLIEQASKAGQFKPDLYV